MSWPLASLVLVSLALAAAFAWYERTRPSSRVLALVATLAALAALGRIAFAPIPNVKPTTDIVLIAGYALGGAPGFAVGALAALSSNLFFGQGPWTPWQMAAWGGVGIAGAALARLTGRHIGRVPLAVACGLAGAGFGLVMNFSTWITYYGGGPDAPSTFGLIAARALPFDVAHVVGNVVFCLAFGPALLRAVARFRARFTVTWLPAPEAEGASASSSRASTTAVALLAALALAGGLLAAQPSTAQARSTGAYLLGAQNADGGWGAAPHQGSAQLYTGWAALGLAAAGHNPLDVGRRGHTPIDFIRRGLSSLTDTGELERTILVVRAAGLSPRRFGGHDLVRGLLGRRRAGGSISGQVVYTSFGVLALRAAGLSTHSFAVARARRWLAGQQNRDGGYNSFGRGGPSGVDDTAAAVQALVAAGARGSSAVSRATAFLVRRQDPTGGFAVQPGSPPNAQSTAVAVQALVAANRNPDRVRRGGRSPLGYLRSLTAGDGSVRYSRTQRQTPVWVSAQALAALARKPFPLAPVRRHRAKPRARAAGAAPSAAGSRGAGSASKDRAASGAPVPAGEPAATDRHVLAIARLAGMATGVVMTRVI